MSGSNTFNNGCPTGVYGTLGQPAAANVPGGRNGAVGWTDSKRNLWLFGGWSCKAFPTGGDVATQSINDPTNCCYNDLWEFDLSTEQWAWMGGSNEFNQPGLYGTLGRRPRPTCQEAARMRRTGLIAGGISGCSAATDSMPWVRYVI